MHFPWIVVSLNFSVFFRKVWISLKFVIRSIWVPFLLSVCLGGATRQCKRSPATSLWVRSSFVSTDSRAVCGAVYLRGWSVVWPRHQARLTAGQEQMTRPPSKKTANQCLANWLLAAPLAYFGNVKSGVYFSGVLVQMLHEHYLQLVYNNILT